MRSHEHETSNTNFVLTSNLTNPKEELDNLRLRNPNRLICAHLNISPLRNKFDLLVEIIKSNIDILMISETKQFVFS